MSSPFDYSGQSASSLHKLSLPLPIRSLISHFFLKLCKLYKTKAIFLAQIINSIMWMIRTFLVIRPIAASLRPNRSASLSLTLTNE